VRSFCSRSFYSVAAAWGNDLIACRIFERDHRVEIHADRPGRRPKGSFMSNQTGDRYSCSDPNCGCEIRIERPCSMMPAGDEYSSESNISAKDQELGSESTGALTGNFRRETTSTPGDFGAQGATGEGTFGTSTTGGGSSMMSGRYDTPGNFVRRTPEETSSTPVQRTVPSGPTCFCGRAMTQVGTSTRAAAARAGAV
jgi:hypothetical protein